MSDDGDDLHTRFNKMRAERYEREVVERLEELAQPALNAFYAARDGRRGVVAVRFEELLRKHMRPIAERWVAQEHES